MRRIRWAEIHNHNAIGYGKGSLERSYRIARGSGLDIYAFTPHGYWPDPPADDPALVEYHTREFDRISAAFPQVGEEANRRYEPGRFVTFIAYEWHTLGWGDYVVLFPSDTGELYRAQNLDDLRDFAAGCDAILIPHHVGYKHGWRGLDWSRLDKELSPLVEVFSEHGNSLEREGLWPMLNHSFGGCTSSQSVMEQVRRGRHIGFTAGTDNHDGHPACYGEGITGVVTEELSREAVFQALRRRHTLAATGDRIELMLEAGDAIMGDVCGAGAKRRFRIQVRPAGPLEFAQIIKNGEPVKLYSPPPSPSLPDEGAYVVRAEWGWGRMGHSELTAWQIDLHVAGGVVETAFPCFCGGEGSRELVNRMERKSPQHVAVESFTSRLNARPISGVVLEVRGATDTTIQCEVTSRTGDEEGGCRLNATIGDLLSDDTWGKVYRRISSPRIRLCRAHAKAGLELEETWEDSEPGEHDLYLLKAQQRNGQTAWTSPILFTSRRS